MSKVEFVSYDGDYPLLCSGDLVLSIDGITVEFPRYCMSSGGSVGFDDDRMYFITCGKWSVKVPEQYAHLRKEIEDCVNANVPYGCCGGCI